MAHQTYVVQDPATGLYLSDYNLGSPENSSFDNLQFAIEFTTLQAAQNAAAAIGGGTVGTVKPS